MVTLEGQFPFNLCPARHLPGTDRAGPERRAVRHRALPVLLRPAQPQAARPTGTPSPTGCSRSATAKTSRASSSSCPLFDPPIDPGMLVQGRRRRARYRQHRHRPQPADRPAPRTPADPEGTRNRRRGPLTGSAGCSPPTKRATPNTSHCCARPTKSTLQQMIQNVRYLQWQHAQETTQGLLRTPGQRTRALHLLPAAARPDPGHDDAPAVRSTANEELTEDNFEDRLRHPGQPVRPGSPLQAYPDPQLAQRPSPSNQSGATGTGQLYLNQQ